MAAETINAEDAAHAAAEASGGLPQLDFSTWSSQIFWLTIAFGLLYIVLWQFILPRIGAGLSDRSDRIADDLDAASTMQKEAEQASIEYDRVMANAKAKAHNIAETTRKSIDTEINEEIETAEAEFAHKQADADARIRKITASALAQIDNVAAETITDITQKVAGVKLSAAQIKSAIASVKG